MKSCLLLFFFCVDGLQFSNGVICAPRKYLACLETFLDVITREVLLDTF